MRDSLDLPGSPAPLTMHRCWLVGSRSLVAAFVLLFFGMVLGAEGCASQSNAAGPQTPDRGPPVDFEFRNRADEVFSAKRTRGRATVVALVTTYDLGSQLLLRRIDEAVRGHRPRANAGAVVMEPPKYGVLLETYKEALELSFPVVLADLATREGRGPFGNVDVLPVLVVLDADGRIVLRHSGSADMRTILDALEQASPAGRGER